jgi:hypothetical protein
MSGIVRTAFLILVWALVTKFTVDYMQDQTATRQLKNSLELATHDATMMIDADALSIGEFVFNQSLAEIVFNASIENNMKLEQNGLSFLPKDDKVFFQNSVKIVHFEYIDDSTYPSLEYPCTYGISCGENKYDIYETVNGPAIIVVAETLSPRAFTTNPKTVRQAVVYEYGTLFETN